MPRGIYQHKPLSEEHKRKIGNAEKGEKHWTYGKPRLEETKRKISQKLKGNVKWWIGRHHSEESKQKMSKARIGRFGKENHWNWKGGVSSEDEPIKRSLEYTIWRNEVYRKDNWTCRLCGKKCRKGDIVAHHLKLFSEFPELRFSIKNGIVLCRSCHIKIHHDTSSARYF